VIQRSDPRVIGGFVLGAIGLLVAAVLVFGSGQVFRKYERAVVFFQGAVSGLRVGAPVDFRGVQVGSVVEISIQYDVSTGRSAIPVVIEIDPARIKTTSRTAEDTRFSIERMVERGLRAELRSVSFVTGQMAVQLNFNPRTEARLSGTDQPYPEIPSVPSTFEQASEILTELAASAPDMVKRLNLVLDRAAFVLGEFADTAPTARAMVGDLAKFSKALGESDQDMRTTIATLSKLMGHGDTAAVEFGETGKRLNRMLADNDAAIKNMIAQFAKVGVGLNQLTERLDLIAQDNREGLKDFSSTGLYDLMNLIRDTQELVGNLNRTIDDFRRNPSQFLFGQQQREVPASRARAP
jgi:paraquat-inducible protein B